MTVQKAKEVMEGIYDYAIPKKEGKRFLENAVDIAIESMKKQIPKKPNIVGEFIKLAECSECRTVIQFKQEYCHKCGNKVDWEEGAE